jgi:sulfate transport system ATP-binding protein
MSFLGPVSKLGDALVRPHDIELLGEPEEGAVEAMVERVARMGFEVRVVLDPAEGEPVDVQITRGHADELEVEPGQVLWLRADPLRTLTAQ